MYLGRKYWYLTSKILFYYKHTFFFCRTPRVYREPRRKIYVFRDFQFHFFTFGFPTTFNHSYDQNASIYQAKLMGSLYSRRSNEFTIYISVVFDLAYLYYLKRDKLTHAVEGFWSKNYN